MHGALTPVTVVEVLAEAERSEEDGDGSEPGEEVAPASEPLVLIQPLVVAHRRVGCHWSEDAVATRRLRGVPAQLLA